MVEPTGCDGASQGLGSDVTRSGEAPAAGPEAGDAVRLPPAGPPWPERSPQANGYGGMDMADCPDHELHAAHEWTSEVHGNLWCIGARDYPAPPGRSADEIRAAIAAEVLAFHGVEGEPTAGEAAIADGLAGRVMDCVVGPLIAERDAAAHRSAELLDERDKAYAWNRDHHRQVEEQRQRAERADAVNREHVRQLLRAEWQWQLHRLAWQSARRRAATAHDRHMVAAEGITARDAAIRDRDATIRRLEAELERTQNRAFAAEDAIDQRDNTIEAAKTQLTNQMGEIRDRDAMIAELREAADSIADRLIAAERDRDGAVSAMATMRQAADKVIAERNAAERERDHLRRQLEAESDAQALLRDELRALREADARVRDLVHHVHPEHVVMAGEILAALDGTDGGESNE